jgi:hypothetical protein
LPVITSAAYAEPLSDAMRATTATTMAGDGTKRRISDLSFDAGVGYAP